MTNFFEKNRAKLVLGIVLFISVFTLGVYARPGIDKLVPEPKEYVAQKSDVEAEIDQYLNSPEYQSEYKAEAEARVKLRIANRLNNEAGIAAKKSEQYQMRALNGISPETATATIALEKAQGRRP